MIDRRGVLAGGAALAVAACTSERRAGTGKIVAAGPPAALLIWAVAPERLAGWPRKPPPRVLAMLGKGADLPEIGGLSGVGRAANLEDIAALNPAMILDYGDIAPAFREIAARTEARLGVPYHLIDGRLEASAEAFMAAGKLLGAARGDELAREVAPLLAAWRKLPPGPRFYYARGSDGLETGFAGSLATGALEGGGWRNVATGGTSLKRVAREAIAAWDPEVIVTLDAGFSRAAADDAYWRQRRGGARRKLLLLPDRPFGWIDRPPSVNRLIGCAWLTGGNGRAAAMAQLLYGPKARLADAAAVWIA